MLRHLQQLAVSCVFAGLGTAVDEEAIPDDEEAAGAEVGCGIKPAATRPGAPMFIRGSASVVGNWLTL
eukprot:10538407-Prorocentrum_lima.AAC.1